MRSLKKFSMFRPLFCFNSFKYMTYTSPKDVLIPRDLLSISYTRSSGPGGQHVNTTNSKAVVKLNLKSSTFLQYEVIERIKELYPNYINNLDELVVSSQNQREQEKNLKEAVSRIKEFIFEASQPKKERLRCDIVIETEDESKHRVQMKRKKSEIKANRSRKLDF